MFTKISKWILFISSYIPLYIIFIVSNLFDIYSNYKSLVGNNTFSPQLLILNSEVNIILILIFTILSIISLILLLLIFKVAGKSSEYTSMYDISKNNKSINEYVLVYILPFITVKTNDYKELVIFIIIFFLIGLLSVKNDMVYINPILYIMKYNIYTFKEDKRSLESSILISQYSILDLKRNSNGGTDKINVRASIIGEGVYYIKSN
ncbi:hypothetical protein [Clostridium nigeriense]|uniref:hypothetical protein n=1 Tax=Clostridium nigeriense TaxID=1805470 RepID=UPI00082CF361|nr:hypothetical protein [Clostridium nigeriense]